MLLPDYFEFMCPVKTGSGAKALEHLPVDLGALNARKPLIITEKKSEETGLIKHLVNAFKTSGLTLGIFDGIDGMANMDTVKDLCGLYLDKGFDSIVALGSGKVVNVAKVVNIAVSGNPEDLKRAQGVENIAEPLKPLVIIPDSSGTGKECSGDVDFGGMFFSSKYLMPNLVTIDPRMIKDTTPEKLVTTGMASLTYAAEAYACPKSNPFSGSYAQLVIDFVMTNLLDVVKDSMKEKGMLKHFLENVSSKESRVALVNGTCMAGYVYANTPRGLAAKLGLEIAKNCDVPQGIAMGILLPYVLEYHAHRKGHDLSKIMRPMAGLDLYCSTPEGQRFDSAMGKIRHLQNELYVLSSASIPRTLEDARLPKDSFAGIADKVAMQSPDKDETQACLMILEHAFYGKPVTP